MRLSVDVDGERLEIDCPSMPVVADRLACLAMLLLVNPGWSFGNLIECMAEFDHMSEKEKAAAEAGRAIGVRRLKGV